MILNRDSQAHLPLPQIAFLFATFIVLLFLALSSIRRPAGILPQNAHQLREVMRLETQPDYLIRQMKMNAAGDTLFATAGYFNYVWHLTEGTYQFTDLRQSGGFIPRIALWDNRPLAMFLDWSGALSLLDLYTGQTLQRFEGVSAHSGEQNWSFSQNGALLAISDQHTLSVIDAASQVRHFTVDAAEGRSFHHSYPAFNADSSLLAVVYRNTACECDPDLTLWNVINGQRHMTLGPFRGGSAQTFAFSDNNQLLAVGGSIFGERGIDAMIQLWNLVTAEELIHQNIGGTSIEEIVISPENRFLAARGSGSIWLWEVDALISGGPPLVEEHGNGSTQHFDGMAFSPDYRLFAYGTPNGRIRLVDTRSGAVAAELRGHSQKLLDLMFSSDARLLVSSGYDRSIRLWALDDPGFIQSPVQQVISHGPEMTPTWQGE
jgi:WD40 repeat protein